MLRPVIVPPAAGDRAVGGRGGEAQVVQRAGAVGAVNVNVSLPLVLSVTTSWLLVGSIEAESCRGAAALISSMIWPRVVGGRPVVLPAAMGDRSIVPWSPLASV